MILSVSTNLYESVANLLNRSIKVFFGLLFGTFIEENSGKNLFGILLFSNVTNVNYIGELFM